MNNTKKPNKEEKNNTLYKIKTHFLTKFNFNGNERINSSTEQGVIKMALVE